MSDDTPHFDLYYICKPGNEPTGPYAVGQIRTMWDSGTITADFKYWDGAEYKRISALIDAAPAPVSSATASPEHKDPFRQSAVDLLAAIVIGLMIAGTLYTSRLLQNQCANRSRMRSTLIWSRRDRLRDTGT